MVINVQIRTFPLSDGNFSSDFQLIELGIEGGSITEYGVGDAVFSTENDAKQAAKYHAIKTIKEKYGDGAQVGFS